MDISFKILIFATLFILVFSLNAYIVFSASDSAVITTQVTGTCNNNGTCEDLLGETELGCSADCGCNLNSACESQRGETESNCSDCVTVVVEPVEPEGPDVEEFSIYIKDIEAKPSFSSAEIIWKTTRQASCSLLWGATSEYKEEVISETQIKTAHSVQLAGLLPDSYYHFKITCQDALALKDQTQDKYFKTLPILKNVTNFTAASGDKKIILAWQNPNEQGFVQVRLVRSDKFFPLHINDGAVIYEGSEQIFADTNLQNGKRYYYTIFAEYNGKKYSSGAIATAVPQADGIIAPPPIIIPAEPGPEIKKLKLEDFEFYSDGKKLAVKNNKTIEIASGKDLIVSIGAEKLPVGVKAIIAGLDIGQNSYLYFFEAGKERTIYYTLVDLSNLKGIYPIKLIVLDSNNRQMQEIEGELKVVRLPEIIEWCLSLFWAGSIAKAFLWIILLLLVIILVLLIRKRKQK